MAKSFVPGDQISSVKIYQSETGKKQQALELSIKDSKDDSYEREQLRAYELSKLRWFYAILTFTTTKSSESIYESLDGQEYMSSGQLLDLSYVPESMEFDSNDVTDSWEPEKDTTEEYFPTNLTHSSMSHTSVPCTFDDDDPKRKETMGKAFEEFDMEKIDDGDFTGLVASGSSDEDEDVVSKRRDAFRGLLAELDDKEKEKQVHKEIVFDLDQPGEKDEDSDSEEEEEKEQKNGK